MADSYGTRAIDILVNCRPYGLFVQRLVYVFERAVARSGISHFWSLANPVLDDAY